MGIKGLLPFLKKSCRVASLDEFRGCTIAVDASCWLHKGAFACAERLANNEETDVRRQAMKAKGKKLLAEGRRAEAYDCFKQSTQINFDMISDVIKACIQLPDVDCIVAPYESDAQLAYFSVQNIAQLIITEDSDLVLFGCSNILFKTDPSGRGYLYEKERLHLSLSPSMDFVKFRRACILAGCDYFGGLEGVGLTKAMKFFNKTAKTDLKKLLPFVGVYLSMPSLKVDKNFIENFIDAENTFLYQPIFDVSKRRRMPLNRPEVGAPSQCYEMDSLMGEKEACSFGFGRTDPHSKIVTNNFRHESANPRSIWYCGDDNVEAWNRTENANPVEKCNFTLTTPRIIEKLHDKSAIITSSPKRKPSEKRAENEVESLLLEYNCDVPQKKKTELKVSRYFANQSFSSGPVVENISSKFIDRNSLENTKKSALQLLDTFEPPNLIRTLDSLESDSSAKNVEPSVLNLSADIFDTNFSQGHNKHTILLDPVLYADCEISQKPHFSLFSSKKLENCQNADLKEPSAKNLANPASPIFDRGSKKKPRSDVTFSDSFKRPKFTLYSSNDSAYNSNTENSTLDMQTSASSHGSGDSGCVAGDTVNSDDVMPQNLGGSANGRTRVSHALIDLTLENNSDHDPILIADQICHKTPKTASRFLQKCRSVGLSKSKQAKSVDGRTLKQANIRDSLLAYAFKRV